jgi:hypothetical protein
MMKVSACFRTLEDALTFARAPKLPVHCTQVGVKYPCGVGLHIAFVVAVFQPEYSHGDA